MNNRESTQSPEPESEYERKLDDMVDKMGISYAEAQMKLEADSQRPRSIDVRRGGTGTTHTREQSLFKAAETLSLFDEL